MKQTIRLTESQLKKVITETIKSVLKEGGIINDTYDDNDVDLDSWEYYGQPLEDEEEESRLGRNNKEKTIRDIQQFMRGSFEKVLIDKDFKYLHMLVSMFPRKGDVIDMGRFKVTPFDFDKENSTIKLKINRVEERMLKDPTTMPLDKVANVIEQYNALNKSKKTKLNKYKYVIKTHSGEDLDDERVVYLNKPYLDTYDNEVPMTLGSNQELIYVGD